MTTNASPSITSPPDPSPPTPNSPTPNSPTRNSPTRGLARPRLPRRPPRGCRIPEHEIVRMGDAVASFAELVAAAGPGRDAADRDDVTRDDVTRTFTTAVHAIAHSLRSNTESPEPPRPSEQSDGHTTTGSAQVGWILVERAAATFQSRVADAHIASRPAPPAVADALVEARRVVTHAGHDRTHVPTVPERQAAGHVVVIVPADARRIPAASIAADIARLEPTKVTILGAQVRVSTPEVSRFLRAEYGADVAHALGDRLLSDRRLTIIAEALAAVGQHADVRSLPARQVAEVVLEMIGETVSTPTSHEVSVVTVPSTTVVGWVRRRVLERRSRRRGAMIVRWT